MICFLYEETDNIVFFLFTSSLYAQTKLKMESVQIGGYVGGA